MFLRKLIGIFIVLIGIFFSFNLFSAENLESSDNKNQNSDKILQNIRSNYASFHSFGAVPDNYIELYFSYPATSYTMNYDSSDNLYKGNIIFDFRIDSATKGGTKSIFQANWEAPFSFTSEEIGNIPHDFYGLKRFSLNSGEYIGILFVKDLNSNKEVTERIAIKVKKIDTNRLGISNIQIANNIIPKIRAKGGEAELFYKNQHYVYPNPQSEVSSEFLTLHIYSEIYNAKRLLSDSIEIKYSIKDAKGDLYSEYIRKKHSFSDAIVETISYPIDAVPTGVYDLSVQVVCNEDTVSESCRFYVINNNIDTPVRRYYTEDEQFDLSEFATMSVDRVELNFDMFKVLATRDELALWKKLTDLKAKQRFLFKFWYGRNSDIGNSFNAQLSEYRDRAKYVNTYYSYAGNENGWNTDRGRIYIKFGEPDYKEEVPGDPTKHSYQIWSYHSIEGGATFVFVDAMGLENYKLVHSTHSGYIHNSNWMNMIYRNNSNDNNNY